MSTLRVNSGTAQTKRPPEGGRLSSNHANGFAPWLGENIIRLLPPPPPPARVPARSAVVSRSDIRTTKGTVTINPTGNLGSAAGAITVSVRFAHDLYIFRNGRIHDRICLI